MMLVLHFLIVCACMLMLRGIEVIKTQALGCFNVSSVVVLMLLVFVFKLFSNEFLKFIERVVSCVE